MISKGQRDLLLVATVLTYIVVVWGGIVCLTDASGGCPDWPWCHGRLLPPPRLDSILEYTHRVLAAMAALSIVASALVGWCRTRSIRWLTWAPTTAVLLLLAVVAFGAIAVLRGLEPGLAALDLGAALLVLALMVLSTMIAFRRYTRPNAPSRAGLTPSGLVLDSPYIKLALGTLAIVFVVLVSGVLVAPSRSSVRCLSWPLYAAQPAPHNWPHTARLLLSIIGGFLVIALLVGAWRGQQTAGPIRSVTALAGLLLATQVAAGAMMPLGGASVALAAIRIAAAASLWVALVMIVVIAGFGSPAPTRPEQTPPE